MQASKKLGEFLQEYELDYRREKEPTVSEKLLRDAETYLDRHQQTCATKDLTKSKNFFLAKLRNLFPQVQSPD